MLISKVVELLRSDHWTLIEGRNKFGPFLLRYRIPVIAPPHTKGYERVLKIVWSYAEENAGEMPSPSVSDKMAEFENRFCEAVERDAIAILTAVLTFDGARQWVFYSADIQVCRE